MKSTSLSFTVSLPAVRETSAESIRRPEEAYAAAGELKNLAQEVFCVLTLNNRHRLIDRHLITLGLLDASLVHPREVFRPAISDSSAAVILIHTHPSGDPTPSAEDLRLTRELVAAGKVLGIRVLDHVILGRPSPNQASPFCSLRESGLAQFTE